MELGRRYKVAALFILCTTLLLLYQIISSGTPTENNRVVSQIETDKGSDNDKSEVVSQIETDKGSDNDTSAERSEDLENDNLDISGTTDNTEAGDKTEAEDPETALIPDYEPAVCPALNESSIIPRLVQYCGGDSPYQNNWRELLEMYNVPATHLFYDTDKNYVWYSVPKIASSNWKRLILHDKYEGKYDHYLTLGDEFPHKIMNECCILNDTIARAQPALSKAYTYTFVRNPWTRLYSAFKDKIKAFRGFNDHHYTKMILYIVRGISLDQLEHTDFVTREEYTITFAEFLTLLAKTDTSSYDIHWTPWFIIVDACQIKFNYIGHVEDMEKVFRELQESVLRNPALKLGEKYRTKAARREVIAQYNKVPAGVLDEVYKRFKDDFIIGGYSRDLNCIM